MAKMAKNKISESGGEKHQALNMAASHGASATLRARRQRRESGGSLARQTA